MRFRPFLIAIALGLLLRLASLPLPGHDDVITWKIWSYAATQDLTGMYGVGGNPPERGIVRWGEQWSTVDYPPLFLYEYAIVGRVFRLVRPAFPDGVPLLLAIKLPILLANAGMTWLLWRTVRQASGSERLARAAAVAYWLNPATIFGGELLGYVDPLLTLPAVAALIVAYQGRAWLAGLLTAVAIATKPQGILIGPAVALALWQAGGVGALMRAGVTGAGSVAAILAPFALRGALDNMWLAFGSFYARRDTMSAYAANLGWLVNWYLRSSMGVAELGWRAFLQVVPRPLAITRFQELGYPNPRPFCTAAIATTVGSAMIVLARVRHLGAVAALAAFTVHAFFVLNVGMHESHQLLEVPLLVLASALVPSLRPLAIVVSAIITLNINFYYGIGIGWGWAIPRQLTGIDVSVALAGVNTFTLIWFGYQLARLTTLSGATSDVTPRPDVRDTLARH